MSEHAPEPLEKLRAGIERQAPFVDIKPYSHNIIGLYLAQIARDYSQADANQAIDDFGLERLGWHKVATDLAPVLDEEGR